MNDHQDSENFSYNRSWDNIEEMLFFAEQEQNKHYMNMRKGNKQRRVYHMRNYKALEGVITALRWVLGDKNITKKEVLGREGQ
tara:strand:- start:377 stop:625 length:249 start_codon:yes stop_codon:yes gene_type:complete